MFADVAHHLLDTFRGQHGPFGIDGRHLLGINGVGCLDGVDVVDAKGQNILIGDGINDGIGMQTRAKHLLGSPHVRTSARRGIIGKDGRTGKAEQEVPTKVLGDLGMHVAELTAMALVEDHHNVGIVDAMLLVGGNKPAELLNGGNDDARLGVFQLMLQHGRGRVGIRSPFFEPLVFAHGLVVQVFTVHHKQHLVDLLQSNGQLGGLKAGKGLARPRGVPDVAPCLDGAGCALVRGRDDALQNALGGYDLIWPHYEQLPIHVEHAVARKDVQQRMLGKEGLGEVNQVGDRCVACIGPPAGKGIAVGRSLFAATAPVFS